MQVGRVLRVLRIQLRRTGVTTKPAVAQQRRSGKFLEFARRFQTIPPGVAAGRATAALHGGEAPAQEQHRLPTMGLPRAQPLVASDRTLVKLTRPLQARMALRRVRRSPCSLALLTRFVTPSRSVAGRIRSVRRPGSARRPRMLRGGVAPRGGVGGASAGVALRAACRPRLHGPQTM